MALLSTGGMFGRERLRCSAVTGTDLGGHRYRTLTMRKAT
jgi:hypothetical protein